MLYTQLHNYSPRAQQLLAAAQRHVDDEWNTVVITAWFPQATVYPNKWMNCNTSRADILNSGDSYSLHWTRVMCGYTARNVICGRDTDASFFFYFFFFDWYSSTNTITERPVDYVVERNILALMSATLGRVRPSLSFAADCRLWFSTARLTLRACANGIARNPELMIGRVEIIWCGWVGEIPVALTPVPLFRLVIPSDRIVRISLIFQH